MAQGFDEFLKARRRNQPIRIDDYEYLRDSITDYQHIGAMSPLAPSPSARRSGHVIDEISLNGMTPTFSTSGVKRSAGVVTSTIAITVVRRGFA
ncbi:MAG: hypothetical protein WDO73_08520 [Ignavibacteriota bacterium]